MENPVRVIGLILIAASSLFAAGDVLLLAGAFDPLRHPRLAGYTKKLSGMERMASYSPRRLVWGGLIGVFSSPFMLLGSGLLFYTLTPAGWWSAAIPAALLAASVVVGAFVHGSFIYLGEYIHLLEETGENTHPALFERIARHQKIMLITYGFLLSAWLVAWVWYAVEVARGMSLLPRWMAAVNPLTLTIAWILVRRLLPRLTAPLEGAAFNLAYLAFFACLTVLLW